MCARSLRLFQVKARAAGDDVLLERDILVDDLPQRQHARLQLAHVEPVGTSAMWIIEIVSSSWV